MIPTFTIGNERFQCPYWDLLPPLSESEREELRTSIQESGIQAPILVSPEGEGGAFRVIDGYHRLLLAVELGLPKVPTKYIAALPVAGKPASVARLSPSAERELALTLNLARRHLSADQRRELVLKLRSMGMSQRAIAQAVGVGSGTVARDLAGAPNGAPETPSTPAPPATIRGRDGKEYPATKPKAPPPPVEAEEAEDESEEEARSSSTPREERPAPFPAGPTPTRPTHAPTPTAPTQEEDAPDDSNEEEGDEGDEGNTEEGNEQGGLFARCDLCQEMRVTAEHEGRELCPTCTELVERKPATKAEPEQEEEPAIKEVPVYLRSGRQDWNTPPTLLNLIRGVDVIALDPCGNADSFVDALIEFREEDNGLAQDWFAEVHNPDLPYKSWGLVFVNPPFENAEQWAKKCAEEAAKGCEVILLTPARVGSAWFHEHVFARAQAVCFPRGRLHFWQDGQEGGPATFDTAIAYFGPAPERFSLSLRSVGACLNLQQPKQQTNAA